VSVLEARHDDLVDDEANSDGRKDRAWRVHPAHRQR
jgi:hypothetical protein